MPKTIFGTTEKSNFILNMDLDKYRSACGKLALVVFWATGLSQLLNHWLSASELSLATTLEGGGFAGLVVYFLLLLRRVSLVFSLTGVFSLFAVFAGLMRKQFSKATAVPYLILLASMVWAMISRLFSYDMKVSLFGYPGREEGWFALLMYAGIFFLGTMLRKKEDLERFARGLLTFGIVQCAVGILQALPFVDYLNPNKGLSPYRNIEPLLFWNVRVPTGMASSPITYAMLLGMLGALSVPAALFSETKKTRTLAVICAALSVVMTLLTHTIAGVTACIGILLLTAVLFAAKSKQVRGKKAALPAAAAAALVCGLAWVALTPVLNHAYFHPDMDTAGTKEKGLTFAAWESGTEKAQLPTGFAQSYSKDDKARPALYDGGLVWDDSFYRLDTSGPYAPGTDVGFEIYDACSVIRYCWAQGVKAIKIDPLLGVGPDNFIYTQLHRSYAVSANPNSVDNPYNEYLYIAATRGVPSLLMHLALIVICFVLLWKRRSTMKSWVRISAACAVLVYCAAAFTGMSVLSVAPVFWMLLGILAADPMPEPVKPVKDENTGKKKKGAAPEKKEASADEKTAASAQKQKNAPSGTKAKKSKKKK